MSDRTRDRVMGGVFLTALAIIVLPMLFDGAGVESPAPPSLPQAPATDAGPVPAMDPANLANAEALRKRIDDEGFDQSTSTKVGDPVIAPADRRLSTTLPPAWGVQLGSFTDRAKAVAMFMAAIPTSALIGGPIAGLLLSLHWLGVPGWRWLFILEGVPPILAGVVTLLYLTDWPRDARWLSPSEQEWISEELERENRAKEQGQPRISIPRVLGKPVVLALAFSYFSINIAAYGMVIWLPNGIRRNSASAPPSTPVSINNAGVPAGPAHSTAAVRSLTSPPPSQPRANSTAPTRNTARAQPIELTAP